jgi:branched-chain amino acid transport system substrate-binding protein
MKVTRLVRAATAAVLAMVLISMLAGCSGGPTSSGGSAANGSASGSSSAGASGQPIKVGAVLSLTGSYAGIGASEKKALDLEVAKINAAGGINGRPIDLVIADDGTDAAKAQAATTKLIDQDKVVAVIGASGTGQTMARRSDLERAGIPNLSLAGGSAVTDKISTQVFQIPWPNRIVVPFVLADMKKRGITKIGVLTDSSGYGKDGLAVIKADAPKAGITIVGEQTFNLGDTDMTAQLTKLRTGTQAILLWTAGMEGATVVKNRDQLQMSQLLFGGSGQARKEFLAGAGAAANGFTFGTGKMLVPAAYAGAPNQAVVEDFAKRYKAAYNADIDIFAGHAYDAIHLFENAAKGVSGTLDATTLRDTIEKTSGFVGVGGTFTFSPTDHNGLTDKDLQIYQAKDGTFVIAK